MNEFFHEKITDTDEELIYGFIYVLNSNSFNEEKDLKNFYNYYFNQIPLKIVITDKSKSSFKRLNKTITEKMKETNIKPFLLGSKDASDYKINIIEFLKEFLEELTEEKLKDIYKFYYSLNIFDIINKNIYITLDKYNFIDSMIETHKNIDQNYLKSRFEFDIKLLFLKNGKYNIDSSEYKNITKNIQKVYYKYIETLKGDLKKDKYSHDEAIFKDYEDKSLYEKIKSYLIENKLPYEIVQDIYYRLRKLYLDIYEKELKKYIINNYLSLGDKYINKYPEYSKILKNIENNFIKNAHIQDL